MYNLVLDIFILILLISLLIIIFNRYIVKYNLEFIYSIIQPSTPCLTHPANATVVKQEDMGRQTRLLCGSISCEATNKNINSSIDFNNKLVLLIFIINSFFILLFV